MASITEKQMDEFKKILAEQGIEFKSEGEARESAENLIRLVKVFRKGAREERGRKARLRDEPNGFSMQGGGRTCVLCYRSYDQSMWYDKNGLKCMACQEALDTKIVPVSVLKDRGNKEHILASTLAWKLDIRMTTLKKMVRQGKLAARIIPGSGEMVFLRKENPNFAAVIKEDLAVMEQRKEMKVKG